MSASANLGGASAPPRTPGVLGERKTGSRAARARGFLNRVGWLAPGLAASLIAWRSWHAWIDHRQRMIPDFDLYTQGGFGVWPTIPGRALGALGPENFARLSIIAGALAVFIACARSRSPVLAALGLVLSPASLYLAYAGIDPIGLLLFVVAAVGCRTLPVAVAAAATHYALLPYVLLELYRRRPNPVVAATVLCVLAVPVAIALTITPYSGLIYGLLDWRILPYSIIGVGAGVALGGLLWLFVSPSKRIIAPFLVGGLLCGVQTHVQARYLLPAVFLLALEAEGPTAMLCWLGKRSPFRGSRFSLAGVVRS